MSHLKVRFRKSSWNGSSFKDGGRVLNGPRVARIKNYRSKGNGT
jgi:hypothetical protein